MHIICDALMLQVSSNNALQILYDASSIIHIASDKIYDASSIVKYHP